MKKVLVFVLSANTPLYGPMIQTSMDTWDGDAVEGVETIFYSGNPTHPDVNRVWSFPVNEDYAQIGYKNLMAFRKSLELEWDYMARPNASCYVHKNRLIEYCQTLPEKGVVMGVYANAHPYCGISRPFLWGGAQLIMSRDVVEEIVRNDGKWRHDLMEDVALSEIVQDLGFVPSDKLPSCSINKNETDWTLIAYNGESKQGEFPEILRGGNHFFFRVKYDPDRSVDADIMRLLKTHL